VTCFSWGALAEDEIDEIVSSKEWPPNIETGINKG
jgi:hypothetical protein